MRTTAGFMKNNYKNLLLVYSPAIFCALLFAVVLVSPDNIFEGAFFGKELGFYIFITLLILYTILFLIINRENAIMNFNFIDASLLSFILWNFITHFISKNYHFNNKLYELYFLLIYYFTVKGFFSKTEFFRQRLLITTVLLFTVACIEVIVGFLQLYGIIPSQNEYFRITGSFHNPVPYSLFLTLSFSCSFSVYVLDLFEEKKYRNFSLITSIAILLIVPFTGNRASWIGIALAIGVALFIKYWHSDMLNKINNRLKTILIVLILLFSVAGILFLINLKRGSTDGRILVWKVSGSIIKDQPFTGVGYGSFNSVYNLYQAKYFRGDHKMSEEILADNVRMAYNDFIEIASETGITGLLIFVIFLYSVLNCFRLRDIMAISLIIPLLICIALALFSYPLNTVPTKVIFFFFVAVLSARLTIIGNPIARVNLNKTVLVALLTISITFSFNQIIKYLKYRNWLYAYNALKNGQPEVSEEYFKKVSDDLKNELHFSVQYAECLYINHKYDEALAILDEMKNIVPDADLFLLMGNSYKETDRNHEAIKCYEEACFMVPGKFIPKYYLTKFYYDIGDLVRADSLAERMFQMKIKVKSDTTLSLINEIKELYIKNKQPVEYARQGH